MGGNNMMSNNMMGANTMGGNIMGGNMMGNPMQGNNLFNNISMMNSPQMTSFQIEQMKLMIKELNSRLNSKNLYSLGLIQTNRYRNEKVNKLPQFKQGIAQLMKK